MKQEDISFHQGHRERLRQKFLEDKITDYELLELLLSFAIPRIDVRPLARGLMKKFGGLYQILTASYEDLISYKGIGKNTAVFIKAIQSVMIKGYKSCLDTRPIFHDENILSNYCKLMLAGKAVEEFHILYLNTDRRLLADDLHSTGTVDWTAVYPREILRRALDLNAKYLVLLHNHPTPNRSFSMQDIETTMNIQHLLSAVDIELYDHFIVSGGILYSAKNMFLLK